MFGGAELEADVRWQGVGVHPTPKRLARAFASKVADFVHRHGCADRPLRLLDACAGDGRLGHAVARRLVARGHCVSVTFVEADSRIAASIPAGKSYSTSVLRESFFDLADACGFDLVVSNPPYLALDKGLAAKFGIEWPDAIDCGRNLYGCALVHCISLATHGGVVAFLGPHGWLTNGSSRVLRKMILSKVEKVRVDAFASRRLFPGVNQDVSIQLFSNIHATEAALAKVTIKYDQESTFEELEHADGAVEQGRWKVRIGAFVWNRERQLIASRATQLPAIYGGNILSAGRIELSIGRYVNRQFLRSSIVPASYTHNGPCILLKRSMRGAPGAWKLDAVALPKSFGPFVPENHVIVISPTSTETEATIASVCDKLRVQLESDLRHSGHANISAYVVRRALARITNDYVQICAN